MPLPQHLHATLHAAYKHKGLSFVRILQRCPTYTQHLFDEMQKNPDKLLLLTHDRGVQLEPTVARIFKNQENHDPADMPSARRYAEHEDLVPIGLLFQDASRPRYEEYTTLGMEMTLEEKLEGLNKELDRFAI